jgi:hypothetical protein
MAMPMQTQMDEQGVEQEIRRLGPRSAFDTLIARNDELIRRPRLDNGRALTRARTAIYTGLVADWAAEQIMALGYDKPFAVAAVGGTGRGEMAPRSDNDFAFLFEDALEGNPFLLELQRQVLHTGEFHDRCGFTCLALPFSLEDVPNLSGKQLNAFLDLRAVHDPGGLVEVFRERIRATFDPFEHFLHVRGFWKDQWEKATTESERLDRFDIKNEGLRVFLAGIWTLAGRNFRHSHEVYEALDDSRDLQAYEFLLRVRTFIHLRREGAPQSAGAGSHPEDVLTFADFNSFGDWLGPEADERARFEFANEVRARLLSARRRVARFAKGILERELRDGRRVSPGSPIVFGVGGLHYVAARDSASPAERSRAALSLLLAAQRYGVPVDPAELQGTFRHAGDWLIPVPELSALFYEQRGSLADSFAFLAQLDSAEERLFPGYARFEVSIDRRILAEREVLRGALERRKLQALENFVREGRARLANAVVQREIDDPARTVWAAAEAALLEIDHLAAVKLALKTKRLPLTADDVLARGDESRPWSERRASGFSEIPLADYYSSCFAGSDFPPETLSLAEFLVVHRRAFKDWSAAGINDDAQVEEFARLCRDEGHLRALFVFTCADRAEWESEDDDPVRWFNTRELYAKTLARFRPAADPTRLLAAAGYAPEHLQILRDFGSDFFGGVYRTHAIRFGAHLVRFVEEPEFLQPKAAILPEGTATILGVAARDYRGLAATISGALWHHNIELRQAHLFSAAQHRLALDFFHITPKGRPLRSDLSRAVEDAIQRRLFITDEDEATLPRMQTAQISLQEWRHGLHCLRLETSGDAGGMIYALTYKIYRHLRGDIFALSAHAARGRAFISIYHRLPTDLSLTEARAVIEQKF